MNKKEQIKRPPKQNPTVPTKGPVKIGDSKPKKANK